jgi:uroporphyrinogen decarboxylase
MRQAGRYLPEYRAIRREHSLLSICHEPELAIEVTLQPVKRFPLDAAILFSDLLIPLDPLGLSFEFVKGEGPSVHHPIREPSDVDRLREFDPRESLSFTMDAIRGLREELDVPLIGFAGAPFTLASYAIEGGPSRHFELTKRLMYEEPEAWHRLLGKLASAVCEYLKAQVEAGVQAVQIFDSWVGALSPEDYREFALPHTSSIFAGLRDLGVPLIHFGTGTGGILRELRDAGASVVGVDWRTDLDVAWKTLGDEVALQGNLDPLTLFAPEDLLLRRIDDVLARAGGRPGHIFNLGHGVLPGTDPERVAKLVDRVHEKTAS